MTTQTNLDINNKYYYPITTFEKHIKICMDIIVFVGLGIYLQH